MAIWNFDIPTPEYFTWDTPGIEALVREVADTKIVAIDTETTGLKTWKDVPMYWSLAFGHRRITLHASTLEFFRNIFKDQNKSWILHNAKFDQHMLANVGCELAGDLEDTMVKHSLLYNEWGDKHGLKEITSWLNPGETVRKGFKETFARSGEINNPQAWILRAEREDFQKLVDYASADAWDTLRCSNSLEELLASEYTVSLFRDVPPYIDTLWDYYHKIEKPYTRVLWSMERAGALFDVSRVDSLKPAAEREIEQLHAKINKIAGKIVNPNSNPQLRELLVEERGLEPLKRTKGGKSGVREASIDAAFLEHYAHTDDLAGAVHDYRESIKLYKTYLVGLSSEVDTRGYIHTSYNQADVKTGRLSSRDPNLQNIPRPENDKWGLRSLFIAPPEMKLVVMDYKQLEFRILCLAVQDEGMRAGILAGKDVHMANAELVYKVPYEDYVRAKKLDGLVKAGVEPESSLSPYIKTCLFQRNAIKTIGFGLLYGMGPKRLAARLGISIKEAKIIVAQFNAALPAVESGNEACIAEAVATGYAYSLLGRRRNLSEIHSDDFAKYAAAERAAKNTPIQSSAADVVRMAQCLFSEADIWGTFGAVQQLQVHDEVVFRVPTEAVDEFIPVVKDIAEHPFHVELYAPLGVDIGSGSNWGEAK